MVVAAAVGHRDLTCYNVVAPSGAHGLRGNPNLPGNLHDMLDLDLQNTTRLVAGRGTISRLPELVRWAAGLDVEPVRVLIVSDGGIVRAGHYDIAAGLLRTAGMEVFSFHDFAENPNSEMVAAGAKFAAGVEPQVLVGLGGGSSLDCAKGINLVHAGGGRIHDYQGIGKARGTLLPMVAVPTTAGTGSEMQSFALISDASSHVKMACGDKRLACRAALLDPELTQTQPAIVTALTGIDAISHAVETLVSTRANAVSTGYSRTAAGLLFGSMARVLDAPADLDARARMQLGAAVAGMAIESSMLGGAHAMANPLTARFGVTHGQAVGVTLPAIVRLNDCPQYESLMADPQIASCRAMLGIADDREPTELLATVIGKLVERSGLQTTLAGLGIAQSDIGPMVPEALAQWTGTFNPVALSEQNVAAAYRSLCG